MSRLQALVVTAIVAGSLQTPALASQPIVYRTQEYTIRTSLRSTEYNRTAEWSWEYPVFLKPERGRWTELNAWLRRVSLQPLALCMDNDLELLVKKSDREVLDFLAESQQFADCGGGQSSLHPRVAFGHYISFVHNTESEGFARMHHGVEVLTFDLRKRAAIDLSTLFKPGALDELRSPPEEESEDARPGCTSRNSFEWHQIILLPPDDVVIEFPFNPAEWQACGWGGETRSGPGVRNLLLKPSELRPIRELRREQPRAQQTHEDRPNTR